jgi:glycosyltransferase involved in cell wall biosynthesis
LSELRIAVVSPFVDRRHGTERALSELLERLAYKYHCEIHLFSERVEDLRLSQPSVPSDSDKSGTIVWHRVPAVCGPHLVRFVCWIVCNTVLRWSHRFFRGDSFDLVLSPGINCLDADVVIVHALFHRLWKLARAAGIDNEQQVGFLRSRHRRAYYGLLTWLEVRVYANRTVTLLAVSRRTANLLQRYFRRADVTVVPNGVDTEEFSLTARLASRKASRRRRRLEDDDFVLLLIGNDWRIKGLATILEAMAALPDLSLHLIVAGSDDGTHFQEMAARLGVASRCQWEPPRYDVIDLYAASDVYVSPSHEDSFGLPVAEAMACGLPAITSAHAGVAGQIHHGVDGFVMPDPNDTRILMHLLERLHRDAEFRTYIGEAAARTAQDWTWNHNAAAIWERLRTMPSQRAGTVDGDD